MFAKYVQYAVLASSVLTVRAQESVPQDLKSGFRDDPQLQVSYTGNAVDGFNDGATFSQADVSKEPTFALGDSSGISPGVLYTILMLDTTSDSSRTLHYARANFKTTGDIVNIATSDAPLFDYKAPGTAGETGSEAKYSFLMYINPNRERISQLQLPAEGELFDQSKFESDNGLRPAVNGLGMTVTLSGSGGAGGGEQQSSSAAGAAPSSAAVQTSAIVAPTSTRAASSVLVSSPPAVVSSPPAPVFSTPSPLVISASAAPFTSVRPTSTVRNSSVTAVPSSPSEPENPVESSADVEGPASTSLIPSTVMLTSFVGGATSEPTASTSAPAVQTDSGASGMGVPVAGLAVVAAVLAW